MPINDQPLVSICIPSYNHAQFLPEAIQSILAQTYQNIEIIIVDDGSTDDSLEIARRYEARHPQTISVHTHPNNANCGISATVNRGFNLSKGKYWSGLSSDDMLYSDKTVKQVAFLEANPDYGFVYSYGDYINTKSEPIEGKFGKDITKDPDPLETLIYENVIPGMSMLIRRDAMECVGLHDESLIYSDWDFWARFFAAYKGGFIAESLVKYRVHTYNTSVGIPVSLNNRHGLEVYLKWQREKDSLPRIGESKYQKIIEEKIKFKQTICYLDEYFLEIGAKNFKGAKNALGRALSSSPAVILTPRRSAAILKHAVINSAASLFRRSDKEK